MTEYNIFRKGLVIGIIILFVGANVIPCISGNKEIIDSLKLKNEDNKSLFDNAPEIEWIKTWQNGNGRHVRVTNDGGYILVGGTTNFPNDNYDVWLIKTDSNGEMMWDKKFDRETSDFGRSIKQTSDGGYIILANSFSNSSKDFDIWLIKIDSNGNKDISTIIGL